MAYSFSVEIASSPSRMSSVSGKFLYLYTGGWTSVFEGGGIGISWIIGSLWAAPFLVASAYNTQRKSRQDHLLCISSNLIMGASACSMAVALLVSYQPHRRCLARALLNTAQALLFFAALCGFTYLYFSLPYI